LRPAFKARLTLNVSVHHVLGFLEINPQLLPDDLDCLEFLTALGQDVQITVKPTRKVTGEMSVVSR